jgi:hypothetical protein
MADRLSQDITNPLILLKGKNGFVEISKPQYVNYNETDIAEYVIDSVVKNQDKEFATGFFTTDYPNHYNIDTAKFAYMIQKLSNNLSMALITFDQHYNEMYDEMLFLIDTSKINSDVFKFYSHLNMQMYNVNAYQVFKCMGYNLKNRAVKRFSDILYALHYSIKNYIKDDEKINLANVNETLTKYFKKSKEYEPIFTYKDPDIKVYIDQNEAYVVHNNEFAFYGGGFEYQFHNSIYRISCGYNVKSTIPKEIKDNQKFHIIYKIAKEIGDFEINKSGIDPRTGDFYDNGVKDNSKIKYVDAESLVLNNTNYNNFYVKKYDYFTIASTSETEEVKDRIKTMDKLVQSV